MAPWLVFVVGKLLDVIADHADEIVAAIKALFPDLSEDHEVRSAINELGYEPCEKNFERVCDLVDSKVAKGASGKLVDMLMVKRAEKLAPGVSGVPGVSSAVTQDPLA